MQNVALLLKMTNFPMLTEQERITTEENGIREEAFVLCADAADVYINMGHTMLDGSKDQVRNIERFG